MDFEKIWTILYIIALVVLIVVLWFMFYRLRKRYSFNPSEEEIIENLRKFNSTGNDNKLFSRTLDDERAFMEDLLLKRFHYLILIFTLFFGASINIASDIYKSIILFVGFIFCFGMSKVVKRAHYKHHWIMQILYGLNSSNNQEIKYSEDIKFWKDHPVKIINDAMSLNERKKKSGGSVSLINGFFLPNLAVYILLISAVYFMGNYFSKELVKPKKEIIEIKYLNESDSIVCFQGEKYIINDKDFVIVNDSLKTYKIVVLKSK
jgi:hypothetical protein